MELAKGTVDRQELVLLNMGDDTKWFGGNLVVHVRVQKHSVYSADFSTHNLAATVEAPVINMLCGKFSKRMTDLDGRTYRLDFDSGVLRPQNSVCIREKGLYRRDGTRAHLMVTLQPAFPESLPPSLRLQLLPHCERGVVEYAETDEVVSVHL